MYSCIDSQLDLDVRMFGCSGVRMLGCSDVRMFGYSDVSKLCNTALRSKKINTEVFIKAMNVSAANLEGNSVPL